MLKEQRTTKALQGGNSMRDYLSPARRVLARVMPHPAAVRAFLMKRRALAFAATASLVVVTTLGFVSVRALVASDQKQQVTEAKGQTSTLTNTAITNDAPQSDSATVSGDNSTANASTPDANVTTSTTVTVNDQKIDVPQNGTVQHISNDANGTTNVTVTTNTSSESGSTAQSYSSTNSQSTTMSSSTSHGVNMNFSTQ